MILVNENSDYTISTAIFNFNISDGNTMEEYGKNIY